MGGPDLPETPAPLKSIQPYLKIANEHDQRDPIISYWCRLYALQTGLKLSTKTSDETAFLLKLMDWLESTKKANAENEAITNDVAAQAHLENWALKLFLYADKNDRASNFGKNVVQSFYTAGLLYDVLTTFGELSEEAIQNKKYAKWKAAYIHNCLKNGETPVPGPLKDNDDNSNENVADNSVPGAKPTLPSQAPYPMQPLIPSQPSHPTPPSNMGAFDFPAVPGHEGENDEKEGNIDEIVKEDDNDINNAAGENNDETARKGDDNRGDENDEELANEEYHEPNYDDAVKNNEDTAEIKENQQNEYIEKSAEKEEDKEDEVEINNNEELVEVGDNQDNESIEQSAEQHPYNPAPTPTNPGTNSNKPATITSEAGVELTPEQSLKAQKYIKWAGSALNYDDVPTSILNLKKALHLLTTGEDPA
ncbi:vacuolar protein sorting-associated protein VTA1 homolog isoform X2 [Phymastichus coffea]|uniref:vacuolar protein sorting-associated protein VTA1 homolog isoform X2 n=1 Tax=Phymastichus coffea TaxID=108790 RepID=UPI00273C0948|nr:vacuolar protein sorting-associated protein VTA1 homolog isoform X2 [Phymastichus coffea]